MKTEPPPNLNTYFTIVVLSIITIIADVFSIIEALNIGHSPGPSRVLGGIGFQLFVAVPAGFLAMVLLILGLATSKRIGPKWTAVAVLAAIKTFIVLGVAICLM